MIGEIRKQVSEMLDQKRVREAFDILKPIGKRKRKKYNIVETELATLYLEVAKTTFDLQQEAGSTIFEYLHTGVPLDQAKGIIVYEGDEVIEVGYDNYYLVNYIIMSLDKAEELANESEDALLLDQVKELRERLSQRLIAEIRKQVLDLMEQKRLREALNVLKVIGKRKRQKYNIAEADLATLYLKLVKIDFDLQREASRIGLTVYEGDKAIEVASYNSHYIMHHQGSSMDKAEKLAKESGDALLLNQVKELSERLRVAWGIFT